MMKLWEVIKELTEDPTKVYKNENGDSMKFTDEGILAWIDDSGKYETTFTVNKNTAYNWQLVRQPVPWQEAIRAWADGKRVTLKLDRREYAFCGFSDPANTRRAIKSCIWYVEE